MFDLHDILQDRAACARYRAERDALAQRMEEVASEIDRTLSGVEGIEDAPAMRWMRGLREALGSMHSPRSDLSDRVESLEEENEELRDMLNGIAFQLGLGDDVHYYSGDNYDACQLEVLWEIESLRTATSPTSRGDAGDASDVTMSAHGLLSKDELRAITWVRRHGGIDEVEHKVAASMETADEYANLQCAIAERCGDLFEMLKLEDDELIAMLDKRLMPEGYEWPRFEGGEPVHIGDEFEKAGKRMTVMAVHFSAASCYLCAGGHGEHYVANGERVKRPASKVLDADGEEIREGDRVWSTQLDEPHEWIVIDPHEDRGYSQTVLVSIGDRTGHARPEDITHRAPVLAADGEPLEVGQTVWGEVGTEFAVKSINHKLKQFTAIRKYDGCECSGLNPMTFTHQRPVLDADGEMLLRGETVYNAVDGEEYRVRGFVDGVLDVCVETADGDAMTLCHDVLIHTKPEPPDSWERWRREWMLPPCDYCKRVLGIEYDHETQLDDAFDAQGDDLVRRARALAAVSE